MLNWLRDVFFFDFTQNKNTSDFYHQINCISTSIAPAATKQKTSSSDFCWQTKVLCGWSRWIQISKVTNLTESAWKFGVLCANDGNFLKAMKKMNLEKTKYFFFIVWICSKPFDEAQKRFHTAKTHSCGSILKYVKIEICWLSRKK